MLTTALILLPIAGALVVAILPLPRETTAGLAFLVALMEVGLWIVAAARFDFDDGGLQLATVARVGREPRDLVLGRLLRLLALARGRNRGRLRRGDRLRGVGRARSPARVPRAHALPARRGRRDLRRAGPPPLLRLLRGDADPALRPRRRVGRRATAGGDRDVRHLHDGGLAAHARVGRRVRRDAGDVLAHRVGDERQRLDLPRLRGRRSRSRRRSSRSTAGCRSRTERRRSRWPRCSRRSSRRRRSTASCGSGSRSSRSRPTTSPGSSSCSRAPASCTARCSRSARPTSAASSRTRRWRRWG